MYAFLAAGAHVGGTTRICLSIGIILLESSGEIAFGLPVFIVVITTKFVADKLTHVSTKIILIVYLVGANK